MNAKTTTPGALGGGKQPSQPVRAGLSISGFYVEAMGTLLSREHSQIHASK